MSLNKLECSDDVKEMTLKIQKCFSENDENLKWITLKQYKSVFLTNKNYKQGVVTSYITVLSTLLDSLKETLFSQKEQELLFDELFLHGVHHQAFLVLVNRVTEKKNYEQQKIIQLLQKFFQGPSLESLLLYQCISHAEWDLKFISKSSFWDDLVATLISLPDRIANKTKGKFSKIFNPHFYVPLLLSSVFKTLSHIHDNLKNSQDCSLEFLAKLTGKLCILGNADIVAKKFCKELIYVSERDFIWRRISHNFIMKMPFRCLDTFIINLLRVIPWYGYVEWLLGDAGVKNEKINYIMTVKLFFVHVLKQDVSLQNTIGYFASSPDRISQFTKILNALLDSWMDPRSLKHQNIEQKIYIAAALMICAGWIRKLENSFDTTVYINKVITGTQHRIGSSDDTVRSLGMIVGENLIRSFDSDTPALEFKHSNTDLLKRLMNLLEIPPKPDDMSINFEDLKCFEEIECEKNRNVLGNSSSAKENVAEPSKNNELDSDDDLEPYDMSNDVVKTELKRPLYLRDCMKGLIDRENREWTELCLKHADELIKDNPYVAKEVAEEMAKIVLHLDDNFAIPDFIGLRHRILITLTVQCPVVVSNYLTSQFSAKDYNIRQRLDILEVLASASFVLSSERLPDCNSQPVKSKEDFIARGEKNWKLITYQKLESKTKRFTKVQKPILMENKFSAVAANFFYPLINSFTRNNKIFKLWDEDSYVLGRLVYTLGIIMISASNTLHCREMGTTLLQFLSSIRSHTDAFVRESIIFAVAATYTAVPFAILFTEMLPDVLDSNEWLQSIAQNDPESKCVEKANYALSVFHTQAMEEPLLHPQLRIL